MLVDLHTHTLASDGELSPQAMLVLQAAEGTRLTAFTDHDTLDGWDQACAGAAATADGPRLISGIEFSSAANGREIHVVGLGFDPDHPPLRKAVEGQARHRRARAEAIGARLEHLGVHGALEGAERLAQGSMLGRPHFARFLVESGRVRNIEAAFRKYLGKGRPAASAVLWPELENPVAWIRAAGGIAVLAHPLAYELSRNQLHALVGRFRECGGEAIEVALPGLDMAKLALAANLARTHGLRASAGSDFHSTAQSWRLPSRIPPLPDFLEPVWNVWV
ncbi:MAG: PHP domain-containing protein [Pseudomonadales bacterium]|nr:PHP domain-containing protein [Pseudomonadales bacterium]